MRSNDGVFVGYDGSDHGRVAVAWAAAEAASLQQPLTICTVLPRAAAEWLSRPGPDGEQARAGADRMIEQGLQVARERQPDLPMRSLLESGDPTVELLRLARTASLLVVGAHGMGGFPALTLGRVGERAALHSPVPVAVVPATPFAATGPVLLGVDDSPAGRVAARYAVQAAARLRRPLQATRAYHEPAAIPAAEYLQPVPEAVLAAEAHKVLDSVLAAELIPHPSLAVERVLEPGPPGGMLVRLAAGAERVVVGAVSHPALAAVLGGVTRAVLHHAPCPVVVIPAPGHAT